MEIIKAITKTDLYQVGIEGILENKIGQSNMSETTKNITRNVLRVGSSLLVGAAAWSCYDGQPTVSANPTPIGNSNSTEMTPTQTSEIKNITAADLIVYKNESERQTIISSLPEDRPENKNDNIDVFKIQVGDQFVNFVMYEVTDEEAKNGVVVKTISNGEVTYSLQNIALYTEVIEYGGTKRWERLIATNPSLNGDNTVWIYDPNGYPAEADQTVDTSRAVLGYDKNGVNILVQPLIIDPNQIAGYDYTQALPVKFNEIPSLMKNASPIKFEVSEEFNTAQALIATSENYTLNSRGQIEMSIGDGGTRVVEGIEFLPDGTMTVTHNDKTFEADASTVVIDGQKITFKDKENKTWVFDGENLKEEVREFVPANGVDFEESLSDLDPKLSSKAKQEEIYWDVIMSKIMDTKSIEENKATHEQILADAELMEKHPEWKELSNNLPKEIKKAYMTEFLKRTGGTMVIKDAKWQKHTVNFNEKIKFTVEEVPAMTSEYSGVFYNAIGFKQHAGENGELTFSIMTLEGEIAKRAGNKGTATANLTVGQYISNLFWHLVSGTTYGPNNYNLDTTNYKLYVGTKPGDPYYYINMGWGFIE